MGIQTVWDTNQKHANVGLVVEWFAKLKPDMFFFRHNGLEEDASNPTFYSYSADLFHFHL